MTNLSELSTEQLLRALPDEDLRRLAQQPESPGMVGDVLRAIPAGVVRGAAGIAGLPGMVSRLGEQAFDATIGRAVNAMIGPPSPEAQAALDRARGVTQATTPSGIVGGAEAVAGGPLYQPQTIPGRIAGSAAEWGTGAALGPLRGLPTAIGLGAAGGAASQGMDEYLSSRGVAPDSWQRTVIPTVTGIATTVGLGIPLARRGAPGDIVEQRLQGVADDPAALAAARERLATGQQIGVPLTPAEALGDQGAALQQLTGNIAASPQGAQLAAALRGRQNQVTNAVRGPGGFLERVSPDASPAVPIAERTAATADDFVRARAQVVDPLFVQQQISRLDEAIRLEGPSTALGRELTQYRNDLARNADMAGGIRPNTDTRVGPLYNQYKDWRRGFNPTVPSHQLTDAQREAAAVMLPVNQETRGMLRDASSTLSDAMDQYAAMSPRVGAARIREGFDQLYERALQSGSTRATNPTVGAQLAQALRGREGGLRANEFEEAIRVAARGAGRNEDDAVREANRFMDALAQTGRIPGVGSETAPRQALTAEARRSLAAAIMSLPRDLAGGGAIAGRLRDMAERGTYGRLSQALMPAGPQSIDDLLALAGRGVPSRQGAIAARALTIAESPGRLQERRR